MKKPSSGQTIIQIFLSLILVLFIISFAVVFTLNFRPLYYLDMGLLNISQTSGYSEEEIRANYDVLIDYNSYLARTPLNFPPFPCLKPGRSILRK